MEPVLKKQHLALAILWHLTILAVLLSVIYVR